MVPAIPFRPFKRCDKLHLPPASARSLPAIPFRPFKRCDRSPRNYPPVSTLRAAFRAVPFFSPRPFPPVTLLFPQAPFPAALA